MWHYLSMWNHGLIRRRWRSWSEVAATSKWRALISHSRGKKVRMQQYAKVRARLSVGDAFVVPAGHPVTVVAAGESDLQLASFGINGAFNQKQFLAGKKNVWKGVEKEAKALSFGTTAEEVEQILERQEESYFLAGPEQKEKGRRHSAAVASILDFTGF